MNALRHSWWVYLFPAVHLLVCLISLSGYIIAALQGLGIVWVGIMLLDLPVSAPAYALAWGSGVFAGLWIILVGTFWWYLLACGVELLLKKLRAGSTSV